MDQTLQLAMAMQRVLLLLVTASLHCHWLAAVMLRLLLLHLPLLACMYHQLSVSHYSFFHIAFFIMKCLFTWTS